MNAYGTKVILYKGLVQTSSDKVTVGQIHYIVMIWIRTRAVGERWPLHSLDAYSVKYNTNK